MRKEIEKWIEQNGAASFDLKNRHIRLNDGGLFSIEKEIKMLPRFRMKKVKEGKHKGLMELVSVKGKKSKHSFYTAIIWFNELDETINYLRRMKKMLNRIGYKTGEKNE